MYQCASCTAVKCKLWRQSYVWLEDVELICWECLEKLGHKIDLEFSDQVYNPEVDSINYLPAVPDLDRSFWGYTSVPRWWVSWWKELPDKRSHCEYCSKGKLEEYDCVFCKGTGIRELEELTAKDDH